jgi:hypothetical protein
VSLNLEPLELCFMDQDRSMGRRGRCRDDCLGMPSALILAWKKSEEAE